MSYIMVMTRFMLCRVSAAMRFCDVQSVVRVIDLQLNHIRYQQTLTKVYWFP